MFLRFSRDSETRRRRRYERALRAATDQLSKAWQREHVARTHWIGSFDVIHGLRRAERERGVLRADG